MPRKLIRKLENSLVLVYTGKPHFASDANRLAIENLKKGKNVKNLLRIKKIAYEMKKSLLKKDLEKFAELMNEETAEREKLHSSIVSLNIKKIIKKGLQNGAISAKICGAGGGGSVLFLGDKRRLNRKFGKKVVDFKFDFCGLKFL